MTERKPWMTISEAAKAFDRSYAMIYKLMKAEKIKSKDEGILLVQTLSIERHYAKPENSKVGRPRGPR